MNVRCATLFLLVGLSLWGQEGVLAEPGVRAQVRQLLARRRLAAPKGRLLPEERDALSYLLAAMPLADLGGPPEALLPAVRASLEARRSVPWGATLPAGLFRTYVLPPRVGKEPLDDFRVASYHTLLERVKGLGMADAALEINFWCLSQVQFGDTDPRCASLQGGRKATIGKCSELANLLTAALRAVAIPARMVELPHWAQKDSYHAWVEVWTDGVWHHMGASEPKGAMDLAWYTEPATRALYIRTFALGPDGPVPPAALDAGHEVDLTGRYTTERDLQVRVLDPEGRPAAGATVELLVHDAGRLASLLTRTCDPQGQAGFRAGGGEYLVWASLDGASTQGKVDLRPGPGRLTLTLGHPQGTVEVDLSPQPGIDQTDVWGKGPPYRTRVQSADAAYRATTALFLKEAQALAVAAEAGYGAAAVGPLRAARGNWREIESFLRRAGSRRQQALALLAALTPKDTWELGADVLMDHLPAAADLDPWVLAPRVLDEPVTAWRGWLRAHVPEAVARAGRRDPQTLAVWLRSRVRVERDCNPAGVPMTPAASLNLGVTDAPGWDICFVALCRALGIPARVNALAGGPEYRLDDRWLPARSRAGAPVALGGVAFDQKPGSQPAGLDPRGLAFGLNLSLARLEAGRLVPVALPAGLALESLPSPLGLAVGDYALVTGNRRGDGTSLVRLSFFTVSAGRTTQLQALRRLP